MVVGSVSHGLRHATPRGPKCLTFRVATVGLPIDDLHPDGELVDAIVRITERNFRLIEQMMTQLARRVHSRF